MAPNERSVSETPYCSTIIPYWYITYGNDWSSMASLTLDDEDIRKAILVSCTHIRACQCFACKIRVAAEDKVRRSSEVESPTDDDNDYGTEDDNDYGDTDDNESKAFNRSRTNHPANSSTKFTRNPGFG